MGNAYIGTSGWNYDHWSKGEFYPRDLKPSEWLKVSKCEQNQLNMARGWGEWLVNGGGVNQCSDPVALSLRFVGCEDPAAWLRAWSDV